MPDSNLIYQLLAGFGLLLSASIGNPVPEEVMIIGSGVQASRLNGQYPGWALLMLPAVLLGAVLTDLVLYGIGRVIGARYMNSGWLRRLAPPAKREKIRENFHRYGFLIFAFGRLVPGVRTTLFLTAGTMRLNLERFLLADGIGALLGGSVFFFLGFGLGQTFADTIKSWEEQVAPYKTMFVILLIVIAVLYLTYRFLRNPIPTGDPEEVPWIGHQIATHMPGHESKPRTNTDCQAKQVDRVGSIGHLGKENRPASGPGE